jgi:methylase of polypeptide subunit release factors
MTRQSYVEFDLQAMMEGQVYPDFVLLWLLVHQSRFEVDDAGSCWLERWAKLAERQGTRVLEHLRMSVEGAITALGQGFLAHRSNTPLRDALRHGQLDKQDYYRQVLRLVYRLLFLFVAEDRDLLLLPSTDATTRMRFDSFYSLDRLRRLAERRQGTVHGDLYQALKLVMRSLDSEGCTPLGLPALGGFLWGTGACPDLDGASLGNRDLLTAVRYLAFFEADGLRRSVDYRNLGAEELGSVYESLLELHPHVEADAARFELISAAGNERKTTGSYYTPTALIANLLDSALEPVLDEAARSREPEQAILDLRVLDPACGSGHFLIAAAQRIATRLASIRTGETTATPAAIRHAMRDVVGRSLYGIDVNPMALELAKVNLWLAAVEPGRPLSFLDHHLVRGNALLGATTALLADGVPDDAFKPITGDNRATVSELRRRNRAERAGQGSLFTSDLAAAAVPLTSAARVVSALNDDTLEAVAAKANRWAALLGSDPYRTAVFAADTWCAAFVAPKTPEGPAITQLTYETAQTAPDRIDDTTRDAVDAVADQYGFLHWHLAFPDVFSDDGHRGFDLVLGNPPWEKVKLSEKEFFATRAPEIAAAAGAKRKTLIAQIEVEDPGLWLEFQAALRQADGESHLLRSTGRFPLCGRGDVNTYAVFAEAMRDALAPRGRLGVILPTGIATDDTTKHFFGDCVVHRRLASLYGFENEEFIFPGIHHATKFCLLTLTGGAGDVVEAEFLFFARKVGDLDDQERRFTLTLDDFALINPNTRTAPIFRTRRAAEITKKIYRRVPVLVREGHADGNPWAIEFATMFHMTNDSGLFRTAEDLTSERAELAGNVWCQSAQRWLPLYEAKMAFHFDHRYGTYTGQTEAQANQGTLPRPSDEDHFDPDFVVQPRYWVPEAAVLASLSDRADWLLGFRNITSAVTERTMIANALPAVGVGHSESIIHSRLDGPLRALLLAMLSSFAHDFVARTKVGGLNFSFFIVNQLAVLPPDRFQGGCEWAPGSTHSDWLLPRILELTYTSHDLMGFAIACGHKRPPFKWDPDRREMLRAELDAAFFRLYELERDEVEYIMDTFTLASERDVARYGEYRTKRLVLERYDALAQAIASNSPYATVLVPGPADPACAHSTAVAVTQSAD